MLRCPGQDTACSYRRSDSKKALRRRDGERVSVECREVGAAGRLGIAEGLMALASHEVGDLRTRRGQTRGRHVPLKRFLVVMRHYKYLAERQPTARIVWREHGESVSAVGGECGVPEPERLLHSALEHVIS